MQKESCTGDLPYRPEDALGSVRVITDSTGSVVAHYEYDAWGNLLPSSADLTPSFAYRFVGSLGVRWDSTLGLYYMRQRWCDLSLQRFISRDLLDSVNRYLYGQNNPTLLTDPSGLLAVIAIVCDGKTTIPMTQVKNRFQSYAWGGLSRFTPVPIAIPSPVLNYGSSPFGYLGLQEFLRNRWKQDCGAPLDDKLKAYYDFWKPGPWKGQHDFKLYNAKFDAFGNFGLGYSGAAFGLNGTAINQAANALGFLLHGSEGQNAMNENDILAGIDAYNRGCQLIVANW